MMRQHTDREHMPHQTQLWNTLNSKRLHSYVAAHKFTKDLQVRRKISATKQNCQLLARAAHYCYTNQTQKLYWEVCILQNTSDTSSRQEQIKLYSSGNMGGWSEAN